jgi:hypothetical protein
MSKCFRVRRDTPFGLEMPGDPDHTKRTHCGRLWTKIAIWAVLSQAKRRAVTNQQPASSPDMPVSCELPHSTAHTVRKKTVESPPKKCPVGRNTYLVFNQQKFLLAVAVGLRPSQVVRSTALGVLFPELQEYIAPRPRVCMSPRLLIFL